MTDEKHAVPVEIHNIVQPETPIIAAGSEGRKSLDSFVVPPIAVVEMTVTQSLMSDSVSRGLSETAKTFTKTSI